MLKQILPLWNQGKSQKSKGSTLQRRLLFFFLYVTLFLIIAFAFLLRLFGINGKEEKALQTYISNELDYISQAIYDDFGQLSVDGINLAETISKISSSFFQENNISANDLGKHPELIEPLLDAQIRTLLYTSNNRACGGVFILLDATVQPDADETGTSRAGIFIKKTQPTTTQSIGVKTHYLRGPAQIARRHGIELIAQWKMEYDIAGEEFFHDVMETARRNPELPLSRLYYWTGRTTLKDNSESGFLLCVPLRSTDGIVFGICGIEVSDRMFKSLYSPHASAYENVFAVAAPARKDVLMTSKGMIAGNSYLTGNRIEFDLNQKNSKNAFELFSTPEETYGGHTTSLQLYPSSSPYQQEKWSVAVLMPEHLLVTAINGNSIYLFLIPGIVLVAGLAVSIVSSHRYLRPVNEAFDSIRDGNYEKGESAAYLEIDDLFGYLAQKDREHEEAIRQHEEELRQLDQQVQHAQNEYAKAQTAIEKLAGEQKKQVDPDSYQLFLDSLHTLTPKEREIFNLYLDGKTAKEILVVMNITENTLKYHNRNIYSKLGVSSRKQLLQYALLANQGENGK